MRKSLIKILQEFSNLHGLKDSKKRITYSEICKLQKIITSSAKESRNTTKAYLKETADDIDLCILGLTSLAMFCMPLTKKEKNKRLLLRSFPANNYHVGACLINIANTAIAINKLCLEGLDTQARILVRTLDERLLQVPVLFATAEDYKKWHTAQSPEASKKAHYELFSKKLYTRYSQLEAKYLSPLHTADWTAWRRENEEYYSTAVHGASVAVQVGSWVFDHETKTVKPNAFGMASSASISTLQHTRFQLFYFTLMFSEILRVTHRWQPDPKNSFLIVYMACIEGFRKTALEWLPESLEDDPS